MIFLALFIVFFGLAAYPFAIYPRLLPFLPKHPMTRGAIPNQRLALYFAAHNEAATLPRTIIWLRQLKTAWPALEIHAFDDGSRDHTRAILNSGSDILHIHSSPIQRGKLRALMQMLATSDCDIAFFMDANIVADVASFENLLGYFHDPNIGAVGATSRPIGGPGTGAELTDAYWRLEDRIKRRESQSGNTIGLDGALFAIRRALYPTGLTPGEADDFRASMNPIFAGYRTVLANDAVVYEESARKFADEFRRKRRIAAGAIASHMAMRPMLRRLGLIDRWKYVSHRILRWGCGGLLLAAMFFYLLFVVQIGRAAMLGHALLLGIVMLAALFFPSLRQQFIRLARAFAFVMAVQIGVCEYFFGRRYAIWAPAQSRNPVG